jgi:hypothetical protein
LLELRAARQAIGERRNHLGDTAAETAKRHGHVLLAQRIEQLARAAGGSGWAAVSQADVPAPLATEPPRAP